MNMFITHRTGSGINLQRFDAYDRNDSAVYLGEYAAHDIGRKNTLRSALAEAAYMTALERNGDIVRLASYAPLLAKQRRTQWVPDLIYFDNITISPSVNYYVQQLFCLNAGDIYVSTEVDFLMGKTLAVSCVQDTKSGDIILKLVNRADVPLHSRFNLLAVAAVQSVATCTVISGDSLTENSFENPPNIIPETLQIPVAQQFTYAVPASSLSIIRIRRQNHL